jgi:hypothetical protein
MHHGTAHASDAQETMANNTLKSLIGSLKGRLSSSRQKQPSARTARVVRNRSTSIDWGLKSVELHAPGRGFSEDAPAANVELSTPDGRTVRLESLAGATTTMVLLISEEMSMLAGIEHRIARRAEMMGRGVHLVCVAEQFLSGVPGAFIDELRRIQAISGGHVAPILVSLDPRGAVFDVVSEVSTIMDWLWNDPRPHSRRATGAMSLGDVTA